MLVEEAHRGGQLACSHTNCKINNTEVHIFRYSRENFNPVKSVIVLLSSVIWGDRCQKSASWLTAKHCNKRRNRTSLKRTTEGKGRVVVSERKLRRNPSWNVKLSSCSYNWESVKNTGIYFKTLLPENYEWDDTFTFKIDIPQYRYVIPSILQHYKKKGK